MAEYEVATKIRLLYAPVQSHSFIRRYLILVLQEVLRDLDIYKEFK